MTTTKIGGGLIKDDTVTATQIAANAVGNSEMADNAIGNAEMADNAIGNAEMADNAVGSAEIVDASVTGADLASAGWTYGSQVATTSGTTVELSAAIPTWATEIEVMLTGVSTSSANQPPLLQLGDSGGYETSGYVGEVTIIQDANPNETAVTDGFSLTRATNAGAADLVTGILRLSRWDTAEHQWIASGQFITESAMAHQVVGYKTTSAAMDRIRLTTTGGAATFDAGEARLRYR